MLEGGVACSPLRTVPPNYVCCVCSFVSRRCTDTSVCLHVHLQFGSLQSLVSSLVYQYVFQPPGEMGNGENIRELHKTHASCDAAAFIKSFTWFFSTIFLSHSLLSGFGVFDQTFALVGTIWFHFMASHCQLYIYKYIYLYLRICGLLYLYLVSACVWPIKFLVQ